jgi:hypothetical protein
LEAAEEFFRRMRENLRQLAPADGVAHARYMKPIQAEQMVEHLSEDLQDLLVREAYIRQRQASYAQQLTEKRVQAQKHAKPSWLFRKGGKDEEETAQAKLQAEIVALEGALASCETILTECEKIAVAELEGYFERFEAYRNMGAAQKLIPQWESAVGLYRSALKRFIQALGIFRNQMASGYDRKTGTFSKGAQEAFAAVTAAAKMLETEALPPNQLGRRHRELLGIASAADDRTFSEVVGGEVSKRVAALKTSTLEIAQTAIGALIAECEKGYESLDAMVADAARVRANVETERARLITTPLAELRAMAETSVDPAQAETVWVSMEARFITMTGGQ